MTNKGTPWSMMRHDYRPNAIGLTTPPSQPQQPQPVTQSPVGQCNPEVSHIEIPSDIGIRLDRTNKLLEEILRIHQHDKITEYDIDISDSVSYTLASGEAAEVSYTVPDNYVMLLQSYFTTLFDDTTYYVYLDSEVWQRSPDMVFIGSMGLAVAPQVTFKMYILNTYSASQSYISSIKASLRREANWNYPTYSYKKPV